MRVSSNELFSTLKIRNDPDKSGFTIERIEIQRVFVGRCVLVDSGNPGHLVMEKKLTAW